MRRRSEVEKEFDVLWREHMRADFPARLRGEEIDGVDAVLLDADVAGCATTWRSSGAPLDEGRLGVLRRCLRDLDAVLSHLSGDEAAYYSRLRSIAELVEAANAGPQP
jgi:hypothetical protein